ncbi:NAD(P)H-binding protein [Edwardsiella piscicida]|uniref:NAD(P)H-binding protein n=1 Tax=Edwardsiella piscicida TaxID=1263550 RepID=UPI0002C13702|nr:NAD(P)H-binding protein [Edwardsiella piscicida]AGH72509.1 hypothetical protein ETAC_01880 [Edwardsiella piscicida C07-087]EKS7780028.1 NAD(P)H-binding protein [Edwardsiella piscicida]EKS7783768.1 NAD(P)H-binding protein [Edwardsiella piscicida]UCQ24847.1 NAD(P)H-binding protein [Edwardsiella piscicida]UCQ34987.1 NAD(P)H-binding protein [Edwardsiella piscicida]
MNVLLLGATGLIGRALLTRLTSEPRVTQIYAPTRTALPASAKLINPVGADICRAMLEWDTPCDVAFCCLGTTRKAAGSDSDFRYVDYSLVVECGAVALQHGCRHYVVVSALGANAQSPFLYSRTKGEMEQALELQAWQRLSLLRPSLLQGERAKPRLLEQISEPLFRLLPEKWKAIEADSVARAMLHCALYPAEYRLQILESEQVQRLGETATGGADTGADQRR